MQHFGTEKITQTLGTKQNHATSRHKKITQPLGQNNHTISLAKKNHALSRSNCV